MVNVIVKKYEHFNHALNKYIGSKRQYDYEMKSRGFVSQEEGNRLAEQCPLNRRKPYVISKKALDIIKAAKSSADRKGRVRLGDRTIEAMKEIGAVKKWDLDRLPKNYLKGGFENASD